MTATKTERNSIVYNPHLVATEERETHLTIDHYANEFSVYTSHKGTSTMLSRRLPEYYTLSADKASASVTNVSLSLIGRVLLSKCKSQRKQTDA